MVAELKTGNGRDAYAALVSATRLLPHRMDIKASLADLLLRTERKRPENPRRTCRDSEEVWLGPRAGAGLLHSA
jgi:hypothetical protein